MQVGQLDVRADGAEDAPGALAAGRGAQAALEAALLAEPAVGHKRKQLVTFVNSWSHMATGCHKWQKLVTNGNRGSQMATVGPGNCWSQIGDNWSQMATIGQNLSNCPKLATIGQNWEILVTNCNNWSELATIGPVQIGNY